VAQGLYQCGGIWESVGPIDLSTNFGIPLGTRYLVQAVGLLDAFSYWGSTGLACIRVTTETTTDVPSESPTSWGRVKLLYGN
jgi:hypothetical protein